jgi:hypothetical protein
VTKSPVTESRRIAESLISVEGAILYIWPARVRTREKRRSNI